MIILSPGPRTITALLRLVALRSGRLPHATSYLLRLIRLFKFSNSWACLYICSPYPFFDFMDEFQRCYVHAGKLATLRPLDGKVVQ